MNPKDKDIEKLKSALALYYVNRVVSSALEEWAEDPADIAGHIHNLCIELNPNTDTIIARIKADEELPEDTELWLTDLWETLDPIEAKKACERICATLVGASIHSRLRSIEHYYSL